MAGGGEDRIHRITATTFQIVSAHQPVVVGVPDDRLDGVSLLWCTSQCARDSALLPGDVHLGVLDSMAAIATIHKAALGLGVGEPLDLAERGLQGMAIEGIAG